MFANTVTSSFYEVWSQNHTRSTILKITVSYPVAENGGLKCHLTVRLHKWYIGFNHHHSKLKFLLFLGLLILFWKQLFAFSIDSINPDRLTYWFNIVVAEEINLELTFSTFCFIIDYNKWMNAVLIALWGTLL